MSDSKITICKKQLEDFVPIVIPYTPHTGRRSETRAEFDEVYKEPRKKIATSWVRSDFIIIAGDFKKKLGEKMVITAVELTHAGMQITVG